MPASLSLSICNYISLAFDCFANLELFAALQMLSNCPYVCVCACVFVCLSPTCSELIWFDWFASFFYVSPPQTIGHLALWLFCFIRKQIREGQLRVCLCVWVCVQLSVSDSCSVFLYMRKVFKAFASEYFFVPFTIVCWMFIELAIALRDCVFYCMSLIFYFAHTLTEK